MTRTLAAPAALVFVLAFALPLSAQVVSGEMSEEQLKWQQVENAGRARQLYTIGEAANKKGDLKAAIRCWAAALELKPDSDATRKSLDKARAQLHKRYVDYASKTDLTKDPLTAVVKLEELIVLIPNKHDLTTRQDTLKSRLSPDQSKALDLYKEAMGVAARKDFPKAKELIDKAQFLERNAACLIDAAESIDAIIKNKWGSYAQAAARKIPKLLFFETTWCPACKKAKPDIQALRSEYQGRLEIMFINAEKNKPLADAYNLRAYPTLIVLNAGNDELDRWEGSPGSEYLKERFGQLGIR